MAEEHHSGALEMGAEMDYAEHEKTYNFFLDFTKYVSIMVVALLIAMAFGFFTTAGFISSFILFLLICGLGAFFLR
ncbi:aa3-type cytochrome c oxidase subunit IV [Aliihoeflea aestuarii]|uniref:aa3-type cytochrome c oxidase subunit IV n=1 Tax=Aliihoeflea aestuarii TaxID=453840 RepID=UPI002093CF00|nr:aa3-type cytochrome c oxidase subunit IV [Aliihoeflea aestuarii]MCO6391883.1 aa3-type cytochrome c oxidase subunit IV [Aliihoeflea aestuarii]